MKKCKFLEILLIPFDSLSLQKLFFESSSFFLNSWKHWVNKSQIEKKRYRFYCSSFLAYLIEHSYPMWNRKERENLSILNFDDWKWNIFICPACILSASILLSSSDLSRSAKRRWTIGQEKSPSNEFTRLLKILFWKITRWFSR